MSEDVNGRQTRPADDVGRPYRSAERASLHRRGRAARKAVGRYAEKAAIAIEQWKQAREWLETIEAAIAAAIEQDGQGLRRREAPYGETPPDAEA